jgi:hypothetical protein
MEPLIIAISGGIGAAAGAFIVYLATRDRRPVVKSKTRHATWKASRRVDPIEMEKARRELNAIILEKDLISSALTRVYEAEVEKRITKQEREELSARYKKRMREVDDRLGNAEVTIEVGDLERLREELLSLFEGKMGQIEERLKEAHTKLDSIKGPPQQIESLEVLEEVERGDIEDQKPRARRGQKRTGEAKVDDKVKELREEVLEALARLEQMDIEG